MTAFSIGLAKKADYARLLSFYYDVIENTPHMPKYGRWKKGLHPKEEAIEGYIGESAMYMLTFGDTIAGAMALTLYEGEDYSSVAWGVEAGSREVAVIHLLAVSPAFQGTGAGKRLVCESIRIAKERGMKAVRLDALATNLPAQRMYETLGFTYRGKRELYAENTGLTDFFYYEYPLCVEKRSRDAALFDIALRRFKADDISDFASLIRDKASSPYAAYDEQFPTDDGGIAAVLSYFAGSDEFFAVADSESGRVIGFASLNLTEDGARNLGLCIRSEYQGKGVGTAVAKKAIEYAKTALCASRLVSGTADANTPAVKLLARTGFVRTSSGEGSFASDGEGRRIVFPSGSYELML